MAHASGNEQWQDFPSTQTPVTATTLENIETFLDDADIRINDAANSASQAQAAAQDAADSASAAQGAAENAATSADNANQLIQNATPNADPDTIVHRDGAGNARFADPLDPQDAATKGYADNNFVAAIKPSAMTQTAVQSALNAAATFGIAAVMLQRGTYTLTSPLSVVGVKLVGERGAIITGSVAAGLVTLSGDSPSVEGLILRNTYTSAGCVAVALAASTTTAVVRNNRIDGNSTVQGVSVNALGISGVLVEGNQFDGLKYGFLSNSAATDLEDVRIIGNRFTNIYGDAVELNHPIESLSRTPYTDGAKHFTISGNYFNVPNGSGNATGFGVGIAGACHVTVTGNTFNGCRVRGVHIEDSAQDITVTGNTFNGIGSAAVTYCAAVYGISFSSDVVVAGNTIRNVTGYGVMLNVDATHQVNRYTVVDNIINTCTLSGIWTSGITAGGDQDIHLRGNTVTACGGDGITLAGPPSVGRMMIANNVCVGNTGYGLNLVRRSGVVIGENVLDGNTAGKWNRTGLAPVALRSAQGRGSATAPAGGTSPAVTLFPLGLRAQGTLTITATASASTSYTTRTWTVTWDGTTLTATQVTTLSGGSMGGITVTAASGNLQATAFSGAGSAVSVQFDADFVGFIVI